jgi:hypothetical protein
MRAPPLPDTHARKALRTVQILARQQWAHDGYRCDLAEYEDAGMAALAACLARFDPQRGVPFPTYVARRIAGAVRDAAQTYRAWHHGHKGPGASAPPRAEVLRPLAGPQPDPVLRTRLLRTLPTLSRGAAALLRRLLAGEELGEVAAAEGVAYITVYMRYRALRQVLKARLGHTTG